MMTWRFKNPSDRLRLLPWLRFTASSFLEQFLERNTYIYTFYTVARYTWQGGVIVRVPSLAFGELPGWFLSLSVKNGLSSSFTRTRSLAFVRANPPPQHPRDDDAAAAAAEEIPVAKLYAYHTLYYTWYTIYYILFLIPARPDSVISPRFLTLQVLLSIYIHTHAIA